MILVTQNNDEYEIRFGYDANIVELVKNVSGRIWHPEEKFWSIPKARLGFLIAQFRGTPYESQLAIKSDEDLNVNASIDEPNTIPDIDVSDVNWYVADGCKVFKHQVDTVKFAKWRYLNGLKSGFILADQPGSGKSLSVTEWAMYMKEHNQARHCLIVACVNSAKYNWREDIIKHTQGKEVPYLLGTRKKRDGSLRLDTGSKEKLEDLTMLKMYGKGEKDLPYFLIINIEAIRMKDGKKFAIADRLIELIDAGEIAIIALDEIHRNTSAHSQQGKQLLRIKKTAKKQIQWIPLTGTPITSRPTDVFLPLRLIDGHASNSYYSWCQEYCVYGGFGDHEIVGYKNIPKLKNLLQPNMLRRLKKDILDLPPKVYKTEYIDNSPYQDKLYKKTLTAVKADKSNILRSLNPMTKLLRLRQVNGSPELVEPSTCNPDEPGYLTKNSKLTRLLELLDDILSEPGEKVVIFSNWVEPLRTLYKYITHNYKVCCYTGTMSAEDREKHKSAFINDSERRVMLGTIGALGTSHTLTVARNVIFYDIPWNPADKEQAEDRCHRPGTTDTVFVYDLVTKDTVDEKVNQILSRKEGTAQYIVDNELDLRSHPELLDFLLD